MDWDTPGQWWQRLSAVIFFGLSCYLFIGWQGGDVKGIVLFISLLLCFLFITLSHKGFYQKWMAFAEKLNKLVITILFGVIYFLFLPFLIFVRFKDPLNIRAHKNKQSLWIDRQQRAETLEHMQRMG